MPFPPGFNSRRPSSHLSVESTHMRGRNQESEALKEGMEELIHCVIFILMFKGSSSFYPWSFWINRFRCGRWQQFAVYSASLEWVRGRGILRTRSERVWFDRTRICELVRNGTCWLDIKEARWWLLEKFPTRWLLSLPHPPTLPGSFLSFSSLPWT